MKKQLNPLHSAEFEMLVNFLAHFDRCGWIPARTVEFDIRKATDAIEEKFGKSKALQGLRMALNDILEMTHSRDFLWICEFDKSCRSLGLTTLSEFRITCWSKYKRLLERGKINNPEQFYMVSAILNDQKIEISTSEREKLNQMMSLYEQV